MTPANVNKSDLKIKHLFKTEKILE